MARLRYRPPGPGHGSHVQRPGRAGRGAVVRRSIVHQHRRVHRAAADQGAHPAAGELWRHGHRDEHRRSGPAAARRLRDAQHDEGEADMSERTLVIMAGGTGGHIMPGLAVAHEMKARGWRVLWLGNPDRMEGKLVPAQGIEMLPLDFSGLRGKGLITLFKLPFTLTKACLQARRALARAQADVVLGMGGYAAFPGGLMARLAGIPLVVHEQNAVAGTANRWLARIARKVLAGFPGALHGAVMVGNPVRENFRTLAPTTERYAGRQGPLRLLVVGGSLGAAMLNEVVPQAVARMAPEERPIVT